MIKINRYEVDGIYSSLFYLSKKKKGRKKKTFSNFFWLRRHFLKFQAADLNLLHYKISYLFRWSLNLLDLVNRNINRTERGKNSSWW